MKHMANDNSLTIVTVPWNGSAVALDKQIVHKEKTFVYKDNTGGWCYSFRKPRLIPAEVFYNVDEAFGIVCKRNKLLIN